MRGLLPQVSDITAACAPREFDALIEKPAANKFA